MGHNKRRLQCQKISYPLRCFWRETSSFLKFLWKGVNKSFVFSIFSVGPFVERDDYSSGVFKTDEGTDCLSFIGCWHVLFDNIRITFEQ